MRTAWLPLLAAGLLWPPAARPGDVGHLPIITRHDVEDSAYLELGARYAAALVGMNLGAEGGPPDGHGVLVAPGWVLTAAHVATEVEPGHELSAGGARHAAAEVILHPEWDGGAGDDIALVRLATAVPNVAPVDLYEANDEVGRTVIVVGRGDLGTGLTGPEGNDRRLRGATNRVDGADEGLLWWRFDAPADRGVTTLEGISGPGDSGGPALVDVDGRVFVAGVSSSQSTRATGGREGVYGVTEYYVRVSVYADWLERTMERTTERATLPATPATPGRRSPHTAIEEAEMQAVARGTFDVELTPEPSARGVGRMSIEKRYHGDLEAHAEGQMLTWRDEESGAATYVAVERVTGALEGREGSFVLAHRGTMTADGQELSVVVAPGSGTGEVAGLEGTLGIEIVDGRHDYELEYRLPGSR